LGLYSGALIMTEKKRYSKYKKNLYTLGDDIFSYNTKVAKFDRKKGEITPLGWWSQTTSKHINFIGKVWDIVVGKGK